MSDPKGISPPDYKATAEKLLSAANDGAKSLKALFFWYVGALAYAVISVAGVTDEQLLKASPLKLPILNVDIPLVEYFAILPLVVVLIHLELLVQFALLSNKVNDFKSGLRHLGAEEASNFRLRLENFMLSHLLAGKHNAILHTLLFLLIQGALVALPLFSLLTIQAQFLAYHSEPMMWWHRVLVLIDALALLYFWPNLFHREDMKAGAWIRLMAFRVLPRVFAFLLLLTAIYVLLAWFNCPLEYIGAVLGLVLGAAIVLSLRAPQCQRCQDVVHVAGHHLARWVLIPLYLIAALAVTYWIDRAWIVSDVPFPTIGVAMALVGTLVLAGRRNRAGSTLKTWTKTLRWAGVSHDRDLRLDAPGMSAFGGQCLLAVAASGWLLSIPMEDESTVELAEVCRHVHPTSYEDQLHTGWHWLLAPALPRKIVHSCDGTWSTNLAGDVISGRASIPAILLNAMGMRRVLLLDEKVLANQELSPGQRQKLRAGDAEARKDIEPIDLRGRDLTGIQLNDAVLPRARFGEATRLRLGSFRGADLQGATFPGWAVHWTQLLEARFQGANFDDSVTFSGAYLNGADLGDVSFVRANLDGALLSETKLTGARFNDAWLQSAILIDPVGAGPASDNTTKQGGLERVHSCLLIETVARVPNRLPLSCRFAIREGTNPPLQLPPPEFWTEFWEAQLAYPCWAQSQRNPREHVSSVFDRLTSALIAHEDVQASMAQAAIAAVTSESCRLRYSREEVEEGYKELMNDVVPEMESGVVPTTTRRALEFFAQWRYELELIEKANQPSATTTQ